MGALTLGGGDMAKVAESEVQRWLQKVKPAKLVAITADGQRIPIKLKVTTLKWKLAEKAVLSIPKVVAIEAFDAKDHLIHRMDLKGTGDETARASQAFDKDNPAGWLDMMLRAQKLALEQQRDVLANTMDVFTRVSKMQSDRLISLENNFAKILQLAQEAVIARAEAQVMHAVASQPSETTSESMVMDLAKMWLEKKAEAAAAAAAAKATAKNGQAAGAGAENAAPQNGQAQTPPKPNGSTNGTNGVH